MSRRVPPTLDDARAAAERGEPLSIQITITPAALGWLAAIADDNKQPGWTPLAELVCAAIVEEWRRSRPLSLPLSPPEAER